MWQERADYGHFFYRIPNGESAADAYDRVSGFNESLWRQFGEDDCASVCVLGKSGLHPREIFTDIWLAVTHGLMSRVFLMKWYHFSVEYFEDLRNVNHCEFLIMRKKEDSGKYILENNLRTWSELKRERLAASKEKEKEKEKGEKAVEAVSPASPVPKRKQWGGCPNGCDHGKHYYKKENSMHAMQLNGREMPEGLAFRRPAARRWQSSSEEDEDDPRGRIAPPKVDVQRSLDEMVSSPDGTPSFISVEDRLRNRLKSPNNFSHRVGRDFGGSASGHTSQAGSDTEASADEVVPKVAFKKKASKISMLTTQDSYLEESGMGRGAKADALGDQSDVGSDGEDEAEPILSEKAEKFERSVEGSVL